ncbi:hypothetical protein [Candidatus Odyssella thessalonicensis]|uniref:hypothetical protein n=1 Tax=Candidatus Odyssella thessalonicensis TaxID=84647 RepID=UPI000225C08F|nr:hypothetical protein [Candidatus Odyssella thessalonicensis]
MCKKYFFNKTFSIALLSSCLISMAIGADKDVTNSQSSSSRSSQTENTLSTGLLEGAFTEATKSQVLKKYPELFKGEETKLLTREDQTQLFDFLEQEAKKQENASQKAYTQFKPYPFLTPYAEKIIAYLSELDFSGKTIIISDLKRYIETQQVSIHALLITLLRAQASMSEKTEEESDLYCHLPRPAEELIDGILINEAWRSDIQAYAQIDKFHYPTPKKSFDDLYIDVINSNFDYEVYQDLYNALEAALPQQIYFTVLGINYFGLHYMIESLLADRFLIAIPKPNQSRSAHGVNMSPLGFTVHDYLHYKIDYRRRALHQYAIELLNKADENGIDYEKAIPIIATRVAHHYQILNSSLAALLSSIDSQAVSDKISKEDYRTLLSGFFWILHETPTAFMDTFKHVRFEDILDHIKNQSHSNLDSHSAWENPFDLLETSPIDGTTVLTDAMIIEKISGNLEESEEYLTNYAYVYPDNIDKIKHGKVIRSKRFIDVILTLKTGKKIYYSIPTLYHKYTNALSNLKSLKWAGEEWSAPPLPVEPIHAREIALETIAIINTKLKENVESFFGTSLIALPEYGHPTFGKIGDWYHTQYTSMLNNYEKALKE